MKPDVPKSTPGSSSGKVSIWSARRAKSPLSRTWKRIAQPSPTRGGGRVVLGVTDKPPRRIVGTRRVSEPEKESSRLTDRLRYIKVRCEVTTPSGRVLVFRVPGRPRGLLIEINGRISCAPAIPPA